MLIHKLILIFFILQVTHASSEEEYIRNIESRVSFYAWESSDKEVHDVVGKYGRNAEHYAVKWGQDGVDLLLAMGLRGIAIAENNEKKFESTLEFLPPEKAAYFLLNTKTFFNELLKSGDLRIIGESLRKLPPEALALGNKEPQLWPYLLISPEKVRKAYETDPTICQQTFFLVNLEEGSSFLDELCDMIISNRINNRKCCFNSSIMGLYANHDFPEVIKIILRSDYKECLDQVIAILDYSKKNALGIQNTKGPSALAEILMKLLEMDKSHKGNTEWGEPQNFRGPGHIIESALRSEKLLILLDKYPEVAYKALDNVLWNLCEIIYERGILDNSVQAILLECLADAENYNRVLTVLADQLERRDNQKRFNANLMQCLRKLAEKENQKLLKGKEIPNVAFFIVAYDNLLHDKLQGWLNKIVSDKKRHLDVELKEYKQNMAVEAIPGHDALRLFYLVGTGNFPTLGEVTWGAIDGAFLIYDVGVIVITFGAAGPAAVASHASAKAMMKSAAKKVIKELPKKLLKKGLKGFKEPLKKLAQKGILEYSATALIGINKKLKNNGMGILKAWSKNGRKLGIVFTGRNIKESSISALKMTKADTEKLGKSGKNLLIEWSENVVIIGTIDHLSENPRALQYLRKGKNYLSEQGQILLKIKMSECIACLRNNALHQFESTNK